jgi:hypothetical protein
MEDRLRFKVEYAEENIQLLESESGTFPPFDDNLSEEDAWGGYVSFVENTPNQDGDLGKVNSVKAFYHKWIFPKLSQRIQEEADGLPRHVMIVDGFKLEFYVKESSIPNGGLGLFVRCISVNPLGKAPRYFKLEAGHLLHLSIYAPLQKEDRRPDFVMLLKNFVHMWEAEGWSFDVAHFDKQGGCFDITDDWTGELNSLARQNFVVYANETDGKNEVQTLVPNHDPEGNIHYFLGHAYEDDGAFQIPANGEEVELKIDYGPKYERVRVRKGYSRLSGPELAKMKAQLENDDMDVVLEIAVCSIGEVSVALEFLERLFERGCLDVERRTRALIAALLLRSRVESFDKERTETDLHEIADRAKTLVSQICSRWKEDEELQESLLSREFYQAVLNETLFLDLESLTAATLRCSLTS